MGGSVTLNLAPVPVDQPSVHAGQLVGLRLISQPDDTPWSLRDPLH